MKKLAILSLLLYILSTLPHLIHIFSSGKYGAVYGESGCVIAGVISLLAAATITWKEKD